MSFRLFAMKGSAPRHAAEVRQRRDATDKLQPLATWVVDEPLTDPDPWSVWIDALNSVYPFERG